MAVPDFTEVAAERLVPIRGDEAVRGPRIGQLARGPTRNVLPLLEAEPAHADVDVRPRGAEEGDRKGKVHVEDLGIK